MARPEIEQSYRMLAAEVASRALAVDIEATFPIERIKDAVEHVGRINRRRKVLVLPNGDITP